MPQIGFEGNFMYDIIIIGAGPAGLSAAIYARRAGKSVLVLEKNTFGGQITFSPKVENYPGFAEISGNELADTFISHAIEQGAELDLAEVTEIIDGEVKKVVTEDATYEAKAVIIATGAKHRKLGLDKEEDFIGEGISFCAVCDGAFYKDMEVAVIGGGNSALQEALLLSETSKKVTVVQNLDFLTGEGRLAEKVYAKDNIEVILGAVVTEYIGEDKLTGIKIKKTNGNEETIALDGVFLAVGLIPDCEAFASVLTLDVRGYAVSDEGCTTASNGIFVAGDCRTKRIRQVATAIADGATAALAACEFIRE